MSLAGYGPVCKSFSHEAPLNRTNEAHSLFSNNNHGFRTSATRSSWGSGWNSNKSHGNSSNKCVHLAAMRRRVTMWAEVLIAWYIKLEASVLVSVLIGKPKLLQFENICETRFLENVFLLIWNAWEFFKKLQVCPREAVFKSAKKNLRMTEQQFHP